ncbi:MAG: BTAD domain-containing putative transcriptional regulator [Ktedonobacteraceae bacterium]
MNVPHKEFSVGIETAEHHLSHSHACYKAYFFGPFRITQDEQPLGEPTWRRNKAKTLLKWFLLNPGDLFSVEQLSKLFWPDLASKVAASNVHVTLHYLRHVLEPDLALGCPSTFIRRNRYNYYWFDLHDVWWTDGFDVQYLSTSAKEAEHKGELSRAIALSCQLVSYYSLEFLPEDIYEDIFSPYRRQHDYAYTQLLEHMMQLYTQTGRLDDALSCALHILSIDPYNEEAVKTMVHVHLHQGNTTGAIRQLDDFQNALKQDMGIEPGKELLTLRSNILKAR